MLVPVERIVRMLLITKSRPAGDIHDDRQPVDGVGVDVGGNPDNVAEGRRSKGTLSQMQHPLTTEERHRVARGVKEPRASGLRDNCGRWEMY